MSTLGVHTSKTKVINTALLQGTDHSGKHTIAFDIGSVSSKLLPWQWAMSEVTRILSQIESGDPTAAEHLLPLLYDELRKLAASKLAQEKPGQTLQATALVHEAYLRLVDVEEAQNWNSRGHFFAAAAEAMRRILIESARRKQSQRQGGGIHRTVLENAAPITNESPDQLLELDDELTRLAQDDSVAAEVFKLCYFAGLTVEHAAEVLGISRASAYRHWTFARAWLHSRVSGED